MLYFTFFLILILLFLLICSKKMNVAEYLHSIRLPVWLIRMSLLMYSFLSNKNWFYSGSCCLPGYKKVANDLKYLNPVEELDQLKECYYITKISKMILSLIFSTLLCFIIMIKGLMNGETKEQQSILRNSYGQEEKQVALVASTGKENIEVQFTVSERHYTLEEFTRRVDEVEKEIQELLQIKNSSFEIWNSVILPSVVEPYPFDIKWLSSRQDILSNNGCIQYDSITEEGKWISLQMTISYDEYTKQYHYQVYIHNNEQSNDYDIKTELLREIERCDQISQCDESLKLPESVNGQSITWNRKKQKNYIVFALIIITLFIIYYLEDRSLLRKAQLKKKQLERIYPEFVSKMTLLLCAGMTPRKAWEKFLLDEMKAKKRNTHKELLCEMQLTFREMTDGIPEIKAYINFGNRCGLRSYQRFTVLITQNIKRGTSKLIEELLSESRNSFDERKKSARKSGEEAGTKLLLPMLIQLVVVMIIVMVPAFMSF